jgi:hypothetical protein
VVEKSKKKGIIIIIKIKRQKVEHLVLLHLRNLHFFWRWVISVLT